MMVDKKCKIAIIATFVILMSIMNILNTTTNLYYQKEDHLQQHSSSFSSSSYYDQEEEEEEEIIIPIPTTTVHENYNVQDDVVERLDLDLDLDVEETEVVNEIVVVDDEDENENEVENENEEEAKEEEDTAATEEEDEVEEEEEEEEEEDEIEGEEEKVEQVKQEDTNDDTNNGENKQRIEEGDRKQLQSHSSDSNFQQLMNTFEFKNETIPKELMRALLFNDNESSNADQSKSKLYSNITLSAIRHLYEGKKLPQDFVIEILTRSKKMLQSMSSVVEVDIPFVVSKNLYSTNTNHDNDGDSNDGEGEGVGVGVGEKESSYVTVVGDTHGRFYGIMHIFDTYGFPTSRTPYIFNGDMIDSGQFSFNLFLSLLMIKLSCPNCIYFTRGNHESSTKYYGGSLKNELQHYGEDGVALLLKIFSETIDELPIAILLNGNECRVLVMHGGIVAEDMTVEHIMNIKRGREPKRGSFFEALLWADPRNEPGVGVGRRGTAFGPDVTKSFLERNELCLLIRGHSYVFSGYRWEHDNKLITLYSAPKTEGHQGAIVRVDRDLDTEFHRYDYPPYPQDKKWSTFVGFDT